MSMAAAARLREVVLRRTPEGEAFSLTGTTKRPRSPDEWRAVMSRFRHWLVDQDLAGVWRVELQKRKAPHVHAILWMNCEFVAQEEIDAEVQRLRWAWLFAIGAAKRRKNGELVVLEPEEVVHAAFVEYGLTAGWVAYLAGHASKHKTEQLGWEGKQWGLWGASKFQPVHELGKADVTLQEKRLFDRTLRRWQRARLRRIGRKGPRALPREGKYVRCYEGGELSRFLRWLLLQRDPVAVETRARAAREWSSSQSATLPAFGWTGNSAATQSGLVPALTV
jgi:hypothetical protein